MVRGMTWSKAISLLAGLFQFTLATHAASYASSAHIAFAIDPTVFNDVSTNTLPTTSVCLGPCSGAVGALGSGCAATTNGLHARASAHTEPRPINQLQEHVYANALAYAYDTLRARGLNEFSLADFLSKLNSALIRVRVHGTLSASGTGASARMFTQARVIDATQPPQPPGSVSQEAAGEPGISRTNPVDGTFFLEPPAVSFARALLSDFGLDLELSLSVSVSIPNDADGETRDALADFQNSMEVVSINFYDASGTFLPGLTITGDSGISYPVNAIAGLPRPNLSARLMGTDTVVISWPSWFSGLILQESSGLGTSWKKVSGRPLTVENENQMEITLSSGSRFYRLSSQ
jgi:hypothetical protein